MAGEAVLIIETALPIAMECVNATAIPKGSVLKITDPFTAGLAAGDEDDVAGIAAEEKIASDGKTKLAVYRRGIFKMLAQGNITAGQAVSTSAATGATINNVAAATKTSQGSQTLGLALESAGDEETLLVELNIGCTTNAYS